MIRGTTPTHTFRVNIDTEKVKEARVIYSQNDREIFCKKTSECGVKDGEISVTLTQAETFKLSCHSNVQIQLRVLMQDGTALASDVMTVSVKKCLSDEVLT